ncbi:MAG: LPS-assembly protein LptD, partial [Paludibacteraceae bacterium]|nr:LPS-assembly protein LptD [Paludibacteraceae bacterium]
MVVFLFFIPTILLGKEEHISDSLRLKQNTTELKKDTDSNTKSPTKTSTKSKIDAKIDYKSRDSIVLWRNGTGFLYGEGEAIYELNRAIQLNAEHIRMVLDSNTVYAEGIVDTLGNEIGSPIFREGTDEYQAKTVKYNLNTRKGYIRRGVTQQGDGFIVANESKKDSDNLLFMRNGKYTTCEDHEHPHFYMQLTKAKVKPGSFVASGPAYLVMADIPLPLAIPFGYFPFNEKYSSGFIMPSYGDEFTRGFYLRNGGYYFAISDYFDLELTGDIYTKGTWALYA